MTDLSTLENDQEPKQILQHPALYLISNSHWPNTG